MVWVLYQLGNWKAGKTWNLSFRPRQLIVPTGELEGRQDRSPDGTRTVIDCTNWGIGRPARHHHVYLALAPHCTNWGIGRPARLRADARGGGDHCTNWGIGRPARQDDSREPCDSQLYQLGNWKAGKTLDWYHLHQAALYQLGNWKAGKTSHLQVCVPSRIVPTGELEGRQDIVTLDNSVAAIVPTGELEGRQD